MSAESWQAIYQSKTDAELAALLVELEKISNLSTQTVGGKSYAVDVGIIRDKMLGITREQQRRAQGVSGRSAFVGQVDFSEGVR